MNHYFSNIKNGGSVANMNTISILIFLASLLFLLTVLIIKYNHRTVKPKYNFLNLAINPLDPQLNLYKGLHGIDSLASVYAGRGMPGYYPHKAWDTLDSNMVPIVHYPFGNYHTPVATAQTAMAFYNRYLTTGDDKAKIGFINNIDWLMQNHQNYYFRYEFKFRHSPASAMEKGWISAMAQGEGLGALCIAFHTTGDDKYLNCARHVFTTLYTNTDSLWCFGIDDKGYYWLEEYPTEDFCHVLNGMLHALWGIWDYYVVTRDEFALTLFKAGIATIAENYSRWKVQRKNSSYYCWHRLVFADYHQVHLTQLKAYADFFGIPEFQDAVDSFTTSDVPIALLPRYDRFALAACPAPFTPFDENGGQSNNPSSSLKLPDKKTDGN